MPSGISTPSIRQTVAIETFSFATATTFERATGYPFSGESTISVRSIIRESTTLAR